MLDCILSIEGFLLIVFDNIVRELVVCLLLDWKN